MLKSQTVPLKTLLSSSKPGDPKGNGTQAIFRAHQLDDPGSDSLLLSIVPAILAEAAALLAAVA